LTNKPRHKPDIRICETNVSFKVYKSLTNCLLCHICTWKTINGNVSVEK